MKGRIIIANGLDLKLPDMNSFLNFQSLLSIMSSETIVFPAEVGAEYIKFDDPP
jgi:hypothetical protein